MMTDDPFYQEFGKLLRRARAPQQNQRPRITQEQLAESLGLSRSSIANIEKGRQPVQLHLVVKMAAILGVEIVDLIPKQLPVLSRERSLAVAELQRQGVSSSVIHRALLHLPEAK
jgi:transcriptional regulator with XRE-family HTH domain